MKFSETNEVPFLNVGSATHVGKVREHNEDALLTLSDRGIWAVADGMGGHEAGEVASQIALEVLEKKLSAGENLEQSILSAHRAILDAAEQGIGAKGMGCTIVALKMVGLRYEIAWVGDSRAYLWSHDSLRQLSHDHSYVQQLMDNGLIDQEEADQHPNKSVLTQALGYEDKPIKVDMVAGTLFRNEAILLCSDGICGEVTHDQLTAVIKGCEKDSQAAVQRLIKAALNAGGHDNATAIIVAAPAAASERHHATQKSKAINVQQPMYSASRKGKKRRLIGVTGAVIGLLLVVSMLWYFGLFQPHEVENGPELLPRVERNSHG